MSALYKWGRHYEADAQVVGEALADLNDNSDEGILAAARKRGSPLHPLFEWDDKEAAHHYRVIQVREVRKSLYIIEVDENKREVLIPALIQRSDHETSGQYVFTPEASSSELDDEEKRFLKEINRLRKRYAGLEFAKGVLQAIDEVRSATALKRKRAASRS
jgi:hypothetical protein